MKGFPKGLFVALRSHLYTYIRWKHFLEPNIKNIYKIQATQEEKETGNLRIYVETPYTMVRDIRTSYEEKDVKAVLGGDLNRFMHRSALYDAHYFLRI